MTPGSFTSYMLSSWRKSILQQLNEREKQEVKPFENLIQHCNKLFESSDSLRSDFLHSYPPSRYNQSDPSNQSSTPAHQLICEKCPVFEKKLFSHQEELTQVHRKKDELSTQIIILNDKIANKEKEKAQIRADLEDTRKDRSEAYAQIKKLEQQISEMENQQQLLKDEYESLQMAYDSLKKDYIKLDKEHKDLVSRVMTDKAKDAERLNQENEKFVRLQRLLKQKELEIAAREMKISTDSQGNSNNIGAVFQADPTFVLAKIPERCILNQEIHDGEVNALKWITGLDKFKRQDVLATGGNDRKVKLWQINQTSLTHLDTFTNSNAGITSIDVDGKYLLASSSDFASRLWTINDSKLHRTFTGHSSKVTAVKFLGVPSKSVSGSHDRTIKVWDINKHVCIRTLFAGSSCNDLVTRQGHEAEVISGHYDKTIRFFDTRTDSSANNIQLQGKITSLTISHNGFLLLSCDRSDTLKLLDLRMNQVIRDFYADGFRVGCDYTRATISPDSEYVAVGSSDGVVFIWNANTGKLEKELKNVHNSNVNACVWSPNGQLLITCDKSKKIAVWSQ